VELLKLLNTNELVAQIICFLIFLAIMRTFLWKKFLGILDKRREAVSSGFKDIEDAKAAVSQIKADYEKRLADIDIEAKAVIREAQAQGRKLAEDLRIKAEMDSEKMVENAKAGIKDEVAKAREELKNNVVDLSIQVAEKIIQEKLSEKSDRRLVEDFIRGIDKK